MFTDTLEKWIDSKDQIFVNIKATACDGFCPIDMANELLNKSYPWMVGRHIHGKKEGIHYHIVGVKKHVKGKPVSHLDYPHPLREVGKKSVQCKTQLYDFGAFTYVVKPKEWATGNCVVQSSFTEEELVTIAERSKVIFDAKKSQMPDMLAAIEPDEHEDAESYHIRLKDAVITKLHKEKESYNPAYRQTILTAVMRHPRFHPYMRKFF